MCDRPVYGWTHDWEQVFSKGRCLAFDQRAHQIAGGRLVNVHQRCQLSHTQSLVLGHQAQGRRVEQVIGPSPLLDVLMEMAESLYGCPRHLGLHSGGMVLSRKPLYHFTPIQTSANGVKMVTFDKEDDFLHFLHFVFLLLGVFVVFFLVLLAR